MFKWKILMSVMLMALMIGCTATPEKEDDDGDDDKKKSPTVVTDTTPPGEITELKSGASDSEIVLNWKDPADEDFASVTVTVSPLVSGSPFTITKGTQALSLTGLSDNTEYSFDIRSTDKNGNVSSVKTITDKTYTCTKTGLSYTLISDGTYRVKADNVSGSVILPGSYNGKLVTRHFFYGCSGLSSITIPKSVTEISTGAFCDCTSLTSVAMPDSITYIGHEAFYFCTGLKNISIPESVTIIGDRSFANCSALTSITIPENVTSIGELAFQSCGNLANIKVNNSNNYYKDLDGVLINKPCTTLIAYPNSKGSAYTIPNSITYIGYAAFYYCTALTSITIPESVTSIGDQAFFGCDNLTSITVSAENNYFKDIDGVLFNKSGTALITCPAAKKGVYNVPDTVTSIEESAFYKCTGLTSVKVESTTPPVLGRSAFYGFTGSILVPSASVDAYKAADGWKEYASKIVGY